MPLTVTSREKIPGVIIVRPEGEIVMNTYHVLEDEVKAILETTPPTLVFDMEQVEYLGSIGIRVLLLAKKRMMAHGGMTLVMNLQSPVKKVLQIVNIFPSHHIASGWEDVEKLVQAEGKEQ